MPLKILILLLICSTIRGQDISYKLHAGSSISWISSNDIKFDENIRPGLFFIQADGSYYYYNNYYVGIGLEFVQLDGTLELEADTFHINDQFFKNVNDAKVVYTGHLLNIPIEMGFDSKKDPQVKFFPFAGGGLINQFALDTKIRYHESNSGLEFTKKPHIYNLSYRFFVGFKWHFHENTLLFLRFHYQKSIFPLAQYPDARLNKISLAIGFEFVPD